MPESKQLASYKLPPPDLLTLFNILFCCFLSFLKGKVAFLCSNHFLSRALVPIKWFVFNRRIGLVPNACKQLNPHEDLVHNTCRQFNSHVDLGSNACKQLNPCRDLVTYTCKQFNPHEDLVPNGCRQYNSLISSITNRYIFFPLKYPLTVFGVNPQTYLFQTIIEIRNKLIYFNSVSSQNGGTLSDIKISFSFNNTHTLKTKTLC